MSFTNNKILSQKLQVTPLKQSQVVTYRLKRAGRIDPTSPDGKRCFPDELIPGLANIYDEGDNSPKSLRYIVGTGTQIIDGKVIEVNENIYFERGDVMCRFDNPTLYEFLERHPLNESNPFRDTSRPALFFRVDEAKEAALKNEEEDLMLDALTLVRELPEQELRNYARSFTDIINPGKIDLGQLRYAMKQKAKANPKEFIKNCDSETAKIKGHISEAIEEEQISFNPATRQWLWNPEGGVFFTVPLELDYMGSLVGFITSQKDGAFVYDEIKRRIMVTETPKLPAQKVDEFAGLPTIQLGKPAKKGNPNFGKNKDTPKSEETQN